MSIESEVEGLRAEGHDIELSRQDGGWAFLTFKEFPLPSGYNKTHTALLIKVPPGYPAAKLDMFWVDADLCIQNSGQPRAGCQLEDVNGKRWLRYSWHVNEWSPGRDNLRRFLSTVRTRLKKLS